MSKITIITASPRQGGNTHQMTKWFTEEAEHLGAEVTTFDAIKLDLDGCHACNACYGTGHACAFEHGFDPVVESVLASDVIVFAVPVYFFAIPGQSKNILDHFYSFLVCGKSLAKKAMLAIGTSGSPVECNVWEGVRVILKKTADMCGMSYDELTYGGMNVPGAINDTDAEEKVKALLQQYVKKLKTTQKEAIRNIQYKNQVQHLAMIAPNFLVMIS